MLGRIGDFLWTLTDQVKYATLLLQHGRDIPNGFLKCITSEQDENIQDDGFEFDMEILALYNGPLHMLCLTEVVIKNQELLPKILQKNRMLRSISLHECHFDFDFVQDCLEDVTLVRCTLSNLRRLQSLPKLKSIQFWQCKSTTTDCLVHVPYTEVDSTTCNLFLML